MRNKWFPLQDIEGRIGGARAFPKAMRNNGFSLGHQKRI